jgi:proteasome beta subunit
VTLPRFDPSDDPGPAFPELLRRVGLAHRFDVTEPTDRLAIAHGTTVVAVKYDRGVIMAGDRRATSGNLISHRTMEKVFPADRWSGVAIAGAAGPAIEMVKLFQLQLEHYEKVEGQPLSLDGKANQLSLMVRGHLPAAMQGLVVVPIFAGYDRLRERGRLFAFDVTGGRYEEGDYTASGSGSLHARTVVKLGYRPEQDADAAIDLVLTALFQAADDDSATGGPDALRGIYPVVARIDADGYERIADDELARRFERVLAEYHGRTGGAEVSGGGMSSAGEGSDR